MQAKIQNVVSTADLQQYIDATKFNNFAWGRYDTEYYGGRCAYVKDDEMNGRVSVFLSGKMISTGAKSVPLSIWQLNHTLELLTRNRLAKKISLNCSDRVQNIVATIDLKMKLDVKKTIHLLTNYIYEPNNFPGIIYKSGQGT